MVMTERWPRLILASNGPTTVVFIASANAEFRDLIRDDFSFELCLRKLSLEQQLKVRNAKHNREKALALGLFSLFTLNLALYSAGAYKAFDPFRPLPLRFNRYGKPSLETGEGPVIEFNSSSSNEIMAVAVQFNGSTPIGIDLSHESQDSISGTHFMEQFEGIFAASELVQLKNIQDSNERYLLFNHLWTLKEGFTKFVGCGLNVDLASFHFTIGPNRPKLVEPTVVREEHYKRLELAWQRDISVDYDNLTGEIKERISDPPVKCMSSILKAGPLLPVFITFVSQAETVDPRVIALDMAEIVQGVIDE
ncbi:hypothetical protein OXX59_000097 [Metschnikowia pulcherrima]